jgi:hypothetical protein
MTQLTNEAFKALLEEVLDIKALSVIDTKVGPIGLFSIFEPEPEALVPTPRQEEILYQIYAANALDVKWLIAAYHLRNDEQYTAINQWLIQKHRTDTIPDLGERYNFEESPT